MGLWSVAFISQLSAISDQPGVGELALGKIVRALEEVCGDSMSRLLRSRFLNPFPGPASVSQ